MSPNFRLSDSVGLWKDLRIIVFNKIPGNADDGSHCYIPFLLPILGSSALALSVFKWIGKRRKEKCSYLSGCGCGLLLDDYCSLFPVVAVNIFWLHGKYPNAGSLGMSHMWDNLHNFLMHSIASGSCLASLTFTFVLTVGRSAHFLVAVCSAKPVSKSLPR